MAQFIVGVNRRWAKAHDAQQQKKLEITYMLLFPTENVRPVQVEALKHVASYIKHFCMDLFLR